MKFYNGAVFLDKVLLLISDAAPFMIYSGKHLKAFHPQIIHVTCIVHSLHRACKDVRYIFPDVNWLLSWATKLFLKCPFLIAKYLLRSNAVSLTARCCYH